MNDSTPEPDRPEADDVTEDRTVMPNRPEHRSLRVRPRDSAGTAQSIRSPTATPAAEPLPVPAAAESADGSEEKPRPPRPTPQEPVALPPRVEELDSDLEAEIEAALSGQGLAAAGLVAGQVDQPAADKTIEADSPEEGSRLTGTIQSVHGDDVFVDVGGRSPAVVALRQFDKVEPVVGDEIELVIEQFDTDEGLIIANLPGGKRRLGGDWSAVVPGLIVDCVVSKTNPGGLEVDVGGLRGFLPAGQVDLAYVEDLEPFVGQKLTVQIVEADPRRRELVVSRRAMLEVERRDAEQTMWKQLEEGQTLKGTVKTIKDFGAFVDLGGVDGLLHIGEIAWTRIGHPSDVLSEGQKIDVKVLGIDHEERRISLGMRQLTEDPWLAAAATYASGQTVSGKVTKTTDFGAFVELEPGVEGLVHISELAHRHVRHVTEVLHEGQQVDVQVLEVDHDRKRIGLSLKALVEPAEETTDDVPDRPAIERRDRSELQGGTGSDSGSLFGEPGEFD